MYKKKIEEEGGWNWMCSTNIIGGSWSVHYGPRQPSHEYQWEEFLALMIISSKKKKEREGGEFKMNY